MLQRFMQMRRSTRWLSALGILSLLGGVHHFVVQWHAEPLCWRACPDEKSGQNDIRSLLYALSTEQFDELHLRFSLGAAQEDDAFLRFGKAFAIVEPKFSPAFDDWIAHEPNAFVPRLARANHLFARAWLARGNDSSNQTSDRQFAEMHRLVQLAQEDVTWARSRAPNSRAAHLLQVQLARIEVPNGLTAHSIQEQAIAAFEACRNPAKQTCDFNPDIWQEIANNLQPKWGGDIESLEALRKRARRSSLSPYDFKILDSHIDCLLLVVNPAQDRDRYPEYLRANIARLDKIIATGPASTTCLYDRIYDVNALRLQLAPENAALELTQLRNRQWDDLQRYLAMVPNHVEFALLRADFYQGQAYQKEKNALLETAAQLSPGTPDILEVKAAMAEQAFDYDAALGFINESLRIRPYNLRTILSHAQLISRDVALNQLAQKQFLALNARMLRTDVDDGWLLAQIQWELRDFKGLLKTTEECVHKANWGSCEVMRAAALVDANRLEEANTLLNEGSIEQRRWTISRVARAMLLLKQGQPDLAIQQFELSAVEFRKDPQLYSAWRDAALAQGHCDAIRAAAGQLDACGKSKLCSADRISSLEILENPEYAQKCPNLQMFMRL